MGTHAVVADPAKAKERARVNEQLLLECVGRANAQGGSGIRGRMRQRSQDVSPKSADCVLSVFAMARASAGSSGSEFEVLSEAFRLLRPGGLLGNAR